MKNDVISPEFDENGRPLRRIRSFCPSQGRLTKGQQHALDNYWPVMGVEFSEQPLDFAGLFGREAQSRWRLVWYGHLSGDHGASSPGAELPRY